MQKYRFRELEGENGRKSSSSEAFQECFEETFLGDRAFLGKIKMNNIMVGDLFKARANMLVNTYQTT